ncbi:MAG: LapA family protein [Chloroflexi bacterium]|nr:LapA family protein [Chloroflexota bacterium]
MLQVIVFLALAFSIVIAIFAVQNTQPVAVSFLTWRVEQVPVSVLVLVSALCGAAAMLFLGLARELRHQLRHRSLSNRLRASQARVDELEAQQSAATTEASVSDKTLELPPAATTTSTNAET